MGPRDGSPLLQRSEDEFIVWVEQTRCFTFKSVNAAALGFVLVLSLLNCRFAKRYAGMGAFIQRHVLNVRDGTAVPDKVLSFVQRL